MSYFKEWCSFSFVLAKFEVELSSDMTARHDNIPVMWSEYLTLLEEAKKALELNKDKFKTELLVQAEVSNLSKQYIVILLSKWILPSYFVCLSLIKEFKEAAKDFCEDFYKTAPCSSDITGKDALSQLKAYRDHLNALRAQEQQIRDGLAVFNLT